MDCDDYPLDNIEGSEEPLTQQRDLNFSWGIKEEETSSF